MCFIFAKYWLIHQCWKIPHFSRWWPSKPHGHTKWKINCFYMTEMLESTFYHYAEPQWSYLLAAEMLFLSLVLFYQENSPSWTMCFWFPVWIQRTLNQVYVFIYSSVKWTEWTVLIVPIFYFLQLLIRATIITNWSQSICYTFGKISSITYVLLSVQCIYISFWFNFIQSK